MEGSSGRDSLFISVILLLNLADGATTYFAINEDIATENNMFLQSLIASYGILNTILFKIALTFLVMLVFYILLRTFKKNFIKNHISVLNQSNYIAIIAVYSLILLNNALVIKGFNIFDLSLMTVFILFYTIFFICIGLKYAISNSWKKVPAN